MIQENKGALLLFGYGSLCAGILARSPSLWDPSVVSTLGRAWIPEMQASTFFDHRVVVLLFQVFAPCSG
jgi:hypothetical protein